MNNSDAGASLILQGQVGAPATRGRPKGPCNEREIAQRRAAAQHSRPNYPAFRWHGEELARLRIAYEGPLKISAIASDFKTSPGRIIQLARKNGWKLRPGTRSLRYTGILPRGVRVRFTGFGVPANSIAHGLLNLGHTYTVASTTYYLGATRVRLIERPGLRFLRAMFDVVGA